MEALIAAGRVAERRGHRFDALRYYGLAETQKPARADLHESIARLLLELGGAHGAVDQAALATPRQLANRAAIRIRRAGLVPDRHQLERFTRLDQVIAEIERLLSQEQSTSGADASLAHQLRGDRAVALFMRKRWQASLDQVRSMRLAGEPIAIYVQVAEAGALLGLKRPEEARRIYESVLDVEPQHLEARWGLFYAAVDLADWSTAYRVVDAIETEPSRRIGIVPTPVPNEDWLGARISAATVRSWADELEEAWNRLTALSQRAPAHPPLRSALASVAAARGWPRLADQEIRIAESLDEEDPGIQVGLAEAALRRGRWAELRIRLDRLSALYPSDEMIQRLQQELAARDRYELQFDVTRRDSAERVRRTPGDSLAVSLRAYGPPLSDPWRLFVARDRWLGQSRGLFTAERQRIGAGAQYRTADTSIETILWQNSGAVDQGAASFEARREVDDHWALSAGYSSFASDTPLGAIARGITSNAARVGLAYVWSELASVEGRVGLYQFSDSNQRSVVDFSLIRRLFTAPDLQISLQPKLSSSSNSRTDGPYFSPERDQSVDVLINLERSLWQRYDRSLSDRLTVGAGRYWQMGYGSGPVYEAAYTQTFKIRPRFELSYGAAWNRRLYDGVPESAVILNMQMMSRF